MITNLYLAASCLVCILSAANAASNSNAQTPRTGPLAGNCVPARDPASKWTCKIDDFQSKCDRQSTASLDPIWRIIDDEAEAQQLLAWQFEKFGNLRDFAQWLVCQGFSVAVSKSESRGDLKADEIGMTACYRLSQGVPVPVPWYRPLPPYGGCFDLIFDKSGGIGTIKHGYNTK